MEKFDAAQIKSNIMNIYKDVLRMVGAGAMLLAFIFMLCPSVFNAKALFVSVGVSLFEIFEAPILPLLCILGALAGLAGFLMKHKELTIYGTGAALVFFIIAIICVMVQRAGFVHLGVLGWFILILVLAAAGIAVYTYFFNKKGAKTAK